MTRERFTVTGPEGEKASENAGAALSCALTRANRAPEPCTYYVRDADGLGLYAVERHDDRTTTVTTHRKTA
jgi:hypothetical protein